MPQCGHPSAMDKKVAYALQTLPPHNAADRHLLFSLEFLLLRMSSIVSSKKACLVGALDCQIALTEKSSWVISTVIFVSELPTWIMGPKNLIIVLKGNLHKYLYSNFWASQERNIPMFLISSPRGHLLHNCLFLSCHPKMIRSIELERLIPTPHTIPKQVLWPIFHLKLH